jgi:Co/Zn/Cd efflux system component
MGSGCCATACSTGQQLLDVRYRRVLSVALAVNASMFGIELAAGLAANSVSLQADSLDFLGDAANYGISLFVLGMAVHFRARAALFKGLTMGLFGFWVIGSTVWHSASGIVPQASTMGMVGFAAFVANLTVFGLLWAYRNGDSNMRSVWVCSRNDAAGNLAVLLAAAGVFGTGAGWPDVIVAGTVALLALQGSVQVMRSAWAELGPSRREAVI